MRLSKIIIIIGLLLASCNNQRELQTQEETDKYEEELFAGGIIVKISEKDTAYIRIYTDSILPMIRIRAIVSDLMEEYGDIYFGTNDKHELGEDYASWTGGMYFDYSCGEVLTKKEFFRSVERDETAQNDSVIKKTKRVTTEKRRKRVYRDHCNEPVFTY